MEFNFPGLSSAQCGMLDRYADLLLEANQQYNLTAARTREDLYLRHFCDSLMPLSLGLGCVESRRLKVLDFGSGAGLPGLPLAIARPDWKLVSVESTGKKARFQQQVIETLALEQVEVLSNRAEVLGHDQDYRERFDLVTARAVASMDILVELGLPLVRPGGALLVWKGPGAEVELHRAANALEQLNGVVEEMAVYDLNQLAEELEWAKLVDCPCFHLITIRKAAALSFGRYPRAYKMIKSRPL